MFFLSPLTPISVLVYDYFLYFALNTGEFFELFQRESGSKRNLYFIHFTGLSLYRRIDIEISRFVGFYSLIGRFSLIRFLLFRECLLSLIQFRFCGPHPIRLVSSHRVRPTSVLPI